ncbi:MAG: DUF4912 domain-containing protein [Phormidesmis sp.]
MMRANRSTLVKLCLLTALAVPVQRTASAAVSQADQAANQAANAFSSTPLVIAQADSTPSEFTPPASLDDVAAIVIDGSSSMRNMTAALGEQFQARYSTTTVDSAFNGTDVALKRLQAGDIDLAAIGRPLTAEEQAAGLIEVPIAREKIAIFVGPDNPFKGDVTFGQFGQIFRGEITEWSEVADGSGTGTIRFIDRPDASDTRQAFRPYPVFQEAPFVTGATAESIEADETEAVIAALGDDGIGYAIANQVMGNPKVKIVSMHQTLPDDPRYPFSQPRSYVYSGEPSPAVQGFLAVAASPAGAEAIAAVQATEGAAAAEIEGPAVTATSPDGSLMARANADNVAIIEDAQGSLVAGPLTGAGGAVTALAFSEDGQTLATGTNTGKVRFWGIDGEPKGEAFPAVLGSDNAVTELRFEGNDQLFVAGSQGRQGLWGLNGLSFGETAGAVAVVDDTASDEESDFPWWLLLIPLLGLIGAGLWLLGRRRSEAVPEPKRQVAPTATVPPPLGDPETEREVSNRAHSVISTDRVTDEFRPIVSEEIATTPPSPLPVGSLDADTDPTVTAFESTDLESPDLEGTNLDLLTPSVIGGGTVLGGMAVAAELNADVESDESDDEDWDENLDLTLDDDAYEPVDKPVDEGAAESMPTAKASLADAAKLGTPAITKASTTDEVEDFWHTEADAPDVSSAPEPSKVAANLSGIESIEPTRDTVIAETETILDIEPTRETIIGDNTVIFGAATTGLATASIQPTLLDTSSADLTTTDAMTAEDPEITESAAAKFDGLDSSKAALGNRAIGLAAGAIASVPVTTLTIEELASVDDGLPELPDGYGESRIVLLPRDPKWAYAYWDVSNEHKESLRQQGGQTLMLRLYDVTDIDHPSQRAHSMQQQECNEMARSWYIGIPMSDRDYTAEIGYLTADDRWLLLARSAAMRVPPIYPSDWVKDQFVTVNWDESLVGRRVGNLGRPDAAVVPGDRTISDLPPIYDELFAFTQGQDALRVAGSLFGSMHQGARQFEFGPGALSPSGSGASLSASGLNMSGVGLGDRKRNFWLVADAELIVYGATEPDATLSVGDRVIPLSPDGTFRFHVAFPDGNIDYPIRAVAADGEQSRAITLNFERQTPERHTNTKAEAEDEWF